MAAALLGAGGGKVRLALESTRMLALGRDLLSALAEVAPGDRSGWLRVLLGHVRQATGASLVYLGEVGADGLERHALLGDRVVRHQQEQLRGVARIVVSRGHSLLESVLQKGTSFRASCDGWEGTEVAGYAAVPVLHRNKGRAWLAALRTAESPPFDADTLGILELAACAFSTALTQESRCKDLETLAMTDGLTHIPNYRYLRLALDAEIARASRHGSIFSVVMVDVDHLKNYNQAHGHLLGSELLWGLAQLLRGAIRQADVVTRYGGDEFLIILPRADKLGALGVSERLRLCVAEGLRGRGGEAISCSFGVASFPEDGRDFESLLSSADRALCQAKDEGRNLVVGLVS